MTERIDAVTQDRALKARHRAMWALGDYPTVASEVIPELGSVLVTATGVRRRPHPARSPRRCGGSTSS